MNAWDLVNYRVMLACTLILSAAEPGAVAAPAPHAVPAALTGEHIAPLGAEPTDHIEKKDDTRGPARALSVRLAVAAGGPARSLPPLTAAPGPVVRYGGPARDAVTHEVKFHDPNDALPVIEAAVTVAPAPVAANASRWIVVLLAGIFVALTATGVALFRRQAGQSTDLQRQMIQELFDRMPLAVSLSDPDGKLQFFNPAYRAIFDKLGDDDLLGLTSGKILRRLIERGQFDLQGGTPEEMLQKVAEALTAGEGNYDSPLYDGRIMHVMVRTLANGTRFVMRQDVTALRRHEREMAALTDRLQMVLDTATNGIIGLSEDRQIVVINPTARHMLGVYTDVLPAPWPEGVNFLHTEKLTPVGQDADPIERALAGQVLSGETNLMSRAQSAENRYVRVSSRPANDPQNNVAAVLIIDDVSEQERNRQQAERAGRLDALGQLTGGIAHDFNNLLATILYALDLAQQNELPPKVQNYLSTARASVTRGSDLTQRLLAFAKRQPGHAESLSVARLMAEIEALIRPTIGADIAVTFTAESDDLFVFCDHGQLENAILNLVINCRDAIQEFASGDRIEISARGVREFAAETEIRLKDPNTYTSDGKSADTAAAHQDGREHRYVEISVTDNGGGMSDEVKRRAIDPFFTTKDDGAGSGLGLSMVYGFVQQADGELRIYSEEGIGTTVRMILPRGTGDGTRESPGIHEAPARGGGQTVLVVEDEVFLLAMVEDLLIALGYNVLTAASGQEALEQADTGATFDVLMTDVVMPGGIGGFDLARRMRARRPDLPVVYMSGYTGFTDIEMGDVVAPMLKKPCQPADLADVLKQALGA